jgi:hypothetical protein
MMVGEGPAIKRNMYLARAFAEDGDDMLLVIVEVTVNSTL